MVDDQDLGGLIVARLYSPAGGIGDLVAVGRMISYCKAPTVGIETADGRQVHWRADMCGLVTADPDVVAALLPKKGESHG